MLGFGQHLNCMCCDAKCVSVCFYVCVCLCVCCEISLGGGGHFRALDQTCEDVFSFEDFLGPREIWTFFLRGLLSGSRKMYVSFCESSQRYKNLYACVCVCTFLHVNVCHSVLIYISREYTHRQLQPLG